MLTCSTKIGQGSNKTWQPARTLLFLNAHAIYIFWLVGGAKKKQTFFLKGSHFCTSHIIHLRCLIYRCCGSSGNFGHFLSVFSGDLVTAYYVGSAIMRAPEQIVGCRKEKEVKDS